MSPRTRQLIPVLEFDSHGDLVPKGSPPADATEAELAELRAAERKDPRFSRLLAAAPIVKVMILIALGLAGCATDYDPHTLGTCVIPDAINGGPSPAFSCEDACADVTFADVNAGKSCTSSSFNAIAGVAGDCQATTAADGTRGCCKLVAPSQDARLGGGATGWEFFACDDQGGGK